MKYPLISVVIATFNSENTLSKVLSSIREQDYPQEKVEILIMDGGSSDSTLSIAKKYKCKIFNNPHGDYVHAKNMGYNLAKGKYLVFFDSDEELVSRSSLSDKLNAMNFNKKVRIVLSSGYKKPISYPEINFYVNDFGDPFSFFMYRSPRDYNFFLDYLKKEYEAAYENEKFVVFDFSKLDNLPFIELTSMGAMIDLDYVRKTFPKVFIELSTYFHLFYFINSKKNLIAITKNDEVIHYSVQSLKKYLKKLSSRINSNVFGIGMGEAGFKGREKFYSAFHRAKKVLFIPYTLTLILPLYDSIKLYLSRRKAVYMLHLFLCIYTVFFLFYFSILKLFGFKAKLFRYGK